MSPDSTKTILFLCTGNACRSQMAEGFAKIRFPECRVLSAGVVASGVHPDTIAVMDEACVDISDQYSKTIDEIGDVEPDIIITLCDNAKESCPAYPGAMKKEHWPITDPAFSPVKEGTRLDLFRKVRDEIARRVEELAI